MIGSFSTPRRDKVHSLFLDTLGLRCLVHEVLAVGHLARAKCELECDQILGRAGGVVSPVFTVPMPVPVS